MTCNNNYSFQGLDTALLPLATANQRISSLTRIALPVRRMLKELRSKGGMLPAHNFLSDTIGGPLKIGALWTARSDNLKIGDIPQLWIGATMRQSIDSCIASGCLQLPLWAGGAGGAHCKGCYAYRGRVGAAQKSILRAHLKGKDYRLKSALRKAIRWAKYVRISAIGDPCVITPLEWAVMIAQIHNAGLKVIGFTAGWRSPAAQHLKGELMASCTNLEEAAIARSMGWNPSIVLDHFPEQQSFKLPDGSRGLVCKAIWMDKKKNQYVTCNECGLCGEDNPGIAIAFPEHD